MNIIIVDDEPKIRRGLKKLFLTIPGWNVKGVFEDATSALMFLSSDEADVIVTDIHMPDVSGLDLIEKIRENNQTIHIIILSGYSNFSYAQRAIEFGVTRYLTKPTNTKELISVMKTIDSKLEEEVNQVFEPIKSEVSNLTVIKAIQYIESNYQNKITLKELSDELYLSPNYLCELFKKHTGKNLSEYMMEYRLEKAKSYLNQLDYKVCEIADMVGFGESKYFSASFKKVYGITPLEYRNTCNDSRLEA